MCARHVLVPRIKYSPHICKILCLIEKKPKWLIIQYYDKLYNREQMGKSMLLTEDGATIFDIWFYMEGVKGVRNRCKKFFRQKELLTEIYSSGMVREVGHGWLRRVMRLSWSVGNFKTPTLWGVIVEGPACKAVSSLVARCAPYIVELIFSIFVPKCILGCFGLIVYKVLPWTLNFEGAWNLVQIFLKVENWDVCEIWLSP